MADLVLWKRLYPNDFNAINGMAAPGGGGGGARHIVLGTRTAENDVSAFLGSNAAPVIVNTEGGPNHPASTLTFGINPSRANEWRIADQVNHRHPGLSAAAGFPAAYDAADRPVVLVLRIDGLYHVRHLTQSKFGVYAPLLAVRARGVAALPPALAAAFDLDKPSALEEFEEQAEDTPPEPFDPANIEDARKRTFAAILRRQGQGKFRADLIDAYHGRCAVTGCSDIWVLEAAHITPYRGAETNAVTNGLLLRADIHTLLDLGLLAIEADSLKVRISTRIKDPAYLGLECTKVAVGKIPPSPLALKEHYQKFEP